MMKFGLIGKHLSHLFSQRFFEAHFIESQQSATYELIEIDSSHPLKKFIRDDILGYRGLNVTIPFKETVIEYLDELSPEAKAIGAVNTIKIFRNGKIKGFNTDAYGFRQSIKPFLDLNHYRAVILGTGGAAKAVEYVLKELGLDVFLFLEILLGQDNSAIKRLMSRCFRLVNWSLIVPQWVCFQILRML